MVFEYILRKNGLDPQKDLTIDQSIDFGSTAAAFTGDVSADFTVEFEPSATALEKEGAGYVVASLGVDSGYVPYTSYSAKTSYMEKNPEIIQKFTNALQKGMEYVQSHTPEEIAEVIAPQFAETDLDTVTAIVKRYYDQDTWKSNLIFEKESFKLLEDILEDSGELSERVSYEDLVTTKYAREADVYKRQGIDRCFRSHKSDICLTGYYSRHCLICSKASYKRHIKPLIDVYKRQILYYNIKTRGKLPGFIKDS